MNEEDLEKRLINQNKRCAICDKPFGKFCVDHDHATTKVRGLLCPNCNVGLGMFKDNALFLKQAISYLEMAKEVGAAPTVACATGV